MSCRILKCTIQSPILKCEKTGRVLLQPRAILSRLGDKEEILPTQQGTQPMVQNILPPCASTGGRLSQTSYTPSPTTVDRRKRKNAGVKACCDRGGEFNDPNDSSNYPMTSNLFRTWQQVSFRATNGWRTTHQPWCRGQHPFLPLMVDERQHQPLCRSQHNISLLHETKLGYSVKSVRPSGQTMTPPPPATPLVKHKTATIFPVGIQATSFFF